MAATEGWMDTPSNLIRAVAHDCVQAASKLPTTSSPSMRIWGLFFTSLCSTARYASSSVTSNMTYLEGLSARMGGLDSSQRNEAIHSRITMDNHAPAGGGGAQVTSDSRIPSICTSISKHRAFYFSVSSARSYLSIRQHDKFREGVVGTCATRRILPLWSFYYAGNSSWAIAWDLDPPPCYRDIFRCPLSHVALQPSCSCSWGGGPSILNYVD